MPNPHDIIDGATGMVVHDGSPLAVTHNSPIERLIAMVESGRDPASLDKLIDAAERMQQIAARQAFNRSLAAFKAECPRVARRNPSQFDRKIVDRDGAKKTVPAMYASIEDIEATIRPYLNKHGLDYTWGDTVIDAATKTLSVRCILSHCDGHSESASVPVPLSESKENRGPSDAQKMMIQQSYARRYSLTAVTGIGTCEDDNDGDDRERGAADADKITEQQVRDLNDLIIQIGHDNAERMTKWLAWIKADSLANVRAADFDRLWNAMTEAGRKNGTIK